MTPSSGANIEVVDNPDDLNTYNHTELYQLCRRAGIAVRPDVSKAYLIALLEGTSELPAGSYNPMDDLRDGLMGFLLEHWRRVHSQLFCPAKSGDPKSCYQCVDAQVMHCLNTNPKIEPGVLAIIKRNKG